MKKVFILLSVMLFSASIAMEKDISPLEGKPSLLRTIKRGASKASRWVKEFVEKPSDMSPWEIQQYLAGTSGYRR